LQNSPFYFFLSLYVALQFTEAFVFLEKTTFYALITVATYYTLKIAQRFVDYSSEKIIEKRREEEKTADVSLIKTLTKIFKALLGVVAVLLIISNLGYDITALLAGLGIGGIAIALALQNILEDIFSSFSIYFDKPFVIGDFIIVGDDLGVVKKIGIKTTRIQHLKGHELIISNKELMSTRINNYGKMEKRRISFKFGVKYETTVEKLEKIPGIVRDVIESIDLTEFSRTHFSEFGDFNLVYEVVYFVETSDYGKYMDIQQAINLGILKKLQKESIEFAYPTQTVHLED
ncbi:unnamed protein product, partial [marine sediment metagenome]